MKRILICIAGSLLFPLLSFEQGLSNTIKLPGFFGDNMVLQRDKPIKFWGTASPNSIFAIEFAAKKKTVTADEQGNWQVIFPKQKAGGGYELKISGDNSFTYKNIIMGDVWITSGQSNMEFRFGDTDSVNVDLAENSNIRYVSMPSYISNYPQTDCRKLEWQLCTKTTAASFSAVAYYFAQKIYKETGVPIGIINSSWGGTSIKAWISEQGIAAIPEYKLLLDSFLNKRNTPFAVDSINARNNIISANNSKKIQLADKGYMQQWSTGKKGDAVWNPIQLPGTWQTGELKDFDGVLWFRKEIELPADVKDELLFIHYGMNLGLNELYINGIKAGTGNYFRSNNRFYLSKNVLLPGKNSLVIRLFEKEPNAAFSAKATEMVIQSVNDPAISYSIAGQWEFATTLTNKEVNELTVKGETAPLNTTVSSIYNVKINPLIPLPIKGMLWYQGESDAAVGFFYRRLFQQMITDWRRQFKQGDLPFIFAQLPVFGKISNEPVEKSEWADIRESQAAVLNLPNTAMAVTLDVGNPADIHPHNKKPVGNRMANAALNMVYQTKNIPLCPMMRSYSIIGNEVHIKFANAGSGLTAKDNYLVNAFAIAGADKKFVLGTVRIVSKDEIVVTGDSIAKPQAVRYAWANSPVQANLINKEGLPAAPFRTDTWPLLTEGKFDNK
jgi:sialate O-acetylesterase